MLVKTGIKLGIKEVGSIVHAPHEFPSSPNRTSVRYSQTQEAYLFELALPCNTKQRSSSIFALPNYGQGAKNQPA